MKLKLCHPDENAIPKNMQKEAALPAGMSVLWASVTAPHVEVSTTFVSELFWTAGSSPSSLEESLDRPVFARLRNKGIMVQNRELCIAGKSDFSVIKKTAF